MADLTPVTRKEHFLSRAAGGPGLTLKPNTREEHFLEAIAEAGTSPGPGGEVTPASVVAATGQMTAEQKAATRANIGATDAATSIPDDVKQALLACFENVAWATANGQQYYDVLETALYPPAGLLSISAVFEQGETVIYDTDSLDALKPMLTVTANYDNGTSKTVTGYTLSGTLTAGTSTITVSYGEKTTTFTVNVSNDFNSVSYIEADGESYINIGFVPDQNTKIVLDYMSLKESGESFNVPIGVVADTDSGNKDKAFFFYIGSANNLVVSVSNTGNTANPSVSVNKNDRKAYSISSNDFSLDGVSYGTPHSTGGDALTSSVGYPFYVFARNHGNTLVRAMSKGRVYELSIYSNNALVKHFVPVLNNTNNTYGLFETESHTFYGNSGTGTITGA